RYYRSIGSPSSDVYDKVSERLRNVHAGTDRGRYGFFHQKDLPGAGLVGSLLDGPAFDLRAFPRNTDADPGFQERPSPHSFGYKIFQHLFHYNKICDSSLTDRTYYFHIGGDMSGHLPGFFPDGPDLFRIFIIYHNRRLLQYKTFSYRINQTDPVTKIYSDITCLHRGILSNYLFSCFRYFATYCPV